MTDMMSFSSNREKKLWVWTLVVVLAIYASLGLEVGFANVLIERGLVTPIRHGNLAAQQ